jgi:hypothetical protein
MTQVHRSEPARYPPLVGLLVLAGAAVVALCSARDYAGGWNDGSRLATVEALVDRHTLAIDDSLFVKVPANGEGGRPAPYPGDEPGLLAGGTKDKLWIRGHFYSDKSPVPALLMAGLYQGWQGATGLTARARVDLFCYWMTLLTSGLAYVAAVWCVYRVGGKLGLPLPLGVALAASFALATVALPYARQVNNHILLLGVTAALMLGLVHLAQQSRAGRTSGALLMGLGTLAGLGYTVDLGAGPVLLACTLGVVAYRCRSWGALGSVALATLPWLALHHALNYAVGGTWKPANAVADYFQWPGCPFNPQNMTGGWNHGSVGDFLSYAADLLVGKRGFLGHNVALFLALPAMALLLWKRTAELPEVLFACCFCGGTWLAYALTSTNYSGACCSVRWFVPLLAPAYGVLAVFLRDHPRFRGDFLVLSGWGAVLAALAWYEGPWMNHMVPMFWPLQGAALASWVAYRGWQRRRERGGSATPAREAGDLAAAA